MTINRRSFLGAIAVAPSLSLVAQEVSAETGSARPQLPVLHRFKLGGARVTTLLDGHLPLSPQLFADFDAQKADEVLMQGLHRMTSEGLNIPVNGYLIELADQKILIDAGTSDLLGPNLGGLGDALAATGVAPEKISTILLTHMHPDHSGGLVNSEGKAIFANAELVVARAEWDFWHDDAVMASVPENSRGFFLMARSTVAPYADRLRLFDGEADIGKGLTALPLPGHTPGHSGFILEGGTEQLLFWGDTVHSTALQFAYPDWTIAFDTDPNQTAVTRRRMLDRAVADNLLLTGSHIDFPGLGRVLRQGDAYAYQPAPWQFGL